MTSHRVNNISISPTMNIAARAIMMKRNKVDLVDLTVGEPDFPTPDHIKKAAKQAIDSNLTKYTINRGIPELRQAVAVRFKKDYGLEYHPDEIIVSNGAKQCLYNVVLSLIDKGDEVIIPAPFYPSYKEMVTLAEGIPVVVPTDENSHFKLMPEKLAGYITDKTRAIIICNPCNPTGMVYTHQELANLAGLIEQSDIYIISDEVYSKLVYDKLPFVSVASVNSFLREKSVIINGVSKAYAMTGWRIGFAAGSSEIIESANKIQSHSTSNACTISQYASLAALQGSQESVEKMCNEFELRRNVIVDELSQISGIRCIIPQGAFYAFPDISALIGKSFKQNLLKNSDDVAEYLLQEAKVAIVPGSAFGSDDHIRISYSNSRENLKEGFRRIKEAISRLD